MVKANNRETKDFNWLTYNGNFDRLKYGEGLNVFLVDTGVVIDMEDYAKRRIQRGEENILRCAAGVLETLAMTDTNHIYFTPKILEELRDHGQNCSFGGKKRGKKNERSKSRPEISPETSELIYSLDGESAYFFSELSPNFFEDMQKWDALRYHSGLAGRAVFNGDTRKLDKDEISATDIELITYALALHGHKYKGIPIDCVNIISSDEHIPRTVSALKEAISKNELWGLGDYKMGPTRVIPSRKDLRSYIK